MADISQIEVNGTKYDLIAKKLSTQIDWDQNDGAAPDYIKNRTHWRETKRTELLEESGQVEGEGTERYFIFDTILAYVNGDTYDITMNDVEYECTAVDLGEFDLTYKGVIVLGNLALLGGENNGYPFLIMSFPSENIHQAVIDSSSITNVTFKIASRYVYHKLHKNFLDIDFDSFVGQKRQDGAEVFNDYLNNYASGVFSHAEGCETTASGNFSHAEGYSTTASGDSSHAEGWGSEASGSDSHAEGGGTTASNNCSHAEGNGTVASGTYSHAEGKSSTASGDSSHAEGWFCTASGNRGSHAEGRETVASGSYSHAEGRKTKASSTSQHVQGKFNIDDANDKYSHIVGNGSSDTLRSNAHTLDWDGNAWFQGNVYVGSDSGINMDGGSKKLATQDMALHFIPSDSFTVIAGSDTSNAYLATKWAVSDVDSITTPKNGMSIALRTPAVGYKGGVLLSIDGGNTYYPIVRNVSTLITTTYGAGSTVILTFNSTQTANPYLTAGTTTTVTGCWQVADYDSNSYAYWRVYRQDSSSYNKDYPLIASRTVASSLGTVGTESSYEAVYGLISDTDANIPKTNPYTGAVKVKSLTVNGEATVGSTTQPIYWNNGVPTETTYTLSKSVPSDALFTDTVCSAYCTCVTPATTATKVIDVVNNDNWELVAGAMISVAFTYTNSAMSPKFNVNGTGAKSVYYGSSAIGLDNRAYAGTKDYICNYIYDGTNFRFHSMGYDANTDTKLRVHRQKGQTNYNGDYPLIASMSKASEFSTTEGDYEDVYGLISAENTNVPTVNPYSGEVKIKSLTASGTIKAAQFDGTVSFATSAQEAVRAIQDGNGKIIPQTYETIDGADAKLKAYAQPKITGAPTQFVYWNTNEYNDMPEVVNGAILIKYTADLAVEEVM